MPPTSAAQRDVEHYPKGLGFSGSCLGRLVEVAVELGVSLTELQTPRV